nr:wd repeat protein iqw1 [Quercus suber]
MKDTLSHKLYHREVRNVAVRSGAHRALYSDRSFVSDLDIVNELDGHSGCVNALSWSKSGNLLASGSDDQHLNIHAYQPLDAGSQFRLTTTVATGHTQNIFSVKFMPHQNDRKVVTAAGDGEVRVFDLEYSGQTQIASSASNIASQSRRRGRNTVYAGVRYLSDGDTDSRVYRSHGDRVKRIVTESSPYLFLTCSEDGEVRQWDLRQPSSAYPAPRDGRHSGGDSQVPPPLISYKRYSLDLNTISCSANQPHYIALGGAHLHALLHDRRMIGRDRLQETGKPLPSVRSMSAEQEGLMQQATRCVRKFAPNGQQTMKRTENGHITACKISDARPDEMIVSWSGDHIYSFDLVRSPDASEGDNSSAPQATTHGHRKRKRKHVEHGSSTSLGQDAALRASSRILANDGATSERSLRIRYANGQNEDIPIAAARAKSPLRSSQQQLAQRIAKATVAIRSSLFGQAARDSPGKFTKALGQAASVFSDMAEVMQAWRYPLDPSPDMVRFQQTLRENRESAGRLVQACGTLARVLGGELRTPSGNSPMLASFASITTRNNDLQLRIKEQFGYDFVKAILLWIESGVGRVVEGFTRSASVAKNSRVALRLPIPEDEACVEAIDEYLIKYLYDLASDKPVVNVDINRFEMDDNRHVFPTEKAAVVAFSAALKIPFADLSSAVTMDGSYQIEAQDRQTAHNFWGLKVARGILLNAAEGVDYIFVDRAFGGLGRVVRQSSVEEAALENVTGAEDEPIHGVELLNAHGEFLDGTTAIAIADMEMETREQTDDTDEGDNDNDDMFEPDVIEDEDGNDGNHDDLQDDDDDFDDSDEGDSEDNDQDDASELDEEDGVPNLGLPRFVYRSAFENRKLRERVEAHVACSSYTRVYRGHCNVRTVKDVNYFGLDDEFVVSGSDDGNLFMWERTTGELVNVLQGDGEVVNVVTGHPYEPMMAVSGIDHTIKIFSPDARAREAARCGNGVAAHDASTFSSLAWPNRIGRRGLRLASDSRPTSTSEPAVPPRISEDDDEYVAPTGLASRKRMHEASKIINQNDMERQGGFPTGALAPAAGRNRPWRFFPGHGMSDLKLGACSSIMMPAPSENSQALSADLHKRCSVLFLLSLLPAYDCNAQRLVKLPTKPHRRASGGSSCRMTAWFSESSFLERVRLPLESRED